LVNQTYPNCWH